jgi:transcriptional regulator with XRE-family HTH domain
MDDEEKRRQIGLRVKEIRREQKLSQGELADRAGINRTYLSMIENGRTSPTVKVIQGLADGLGVKIGQLISGEEKTHYTLDTPEEFEMYSGLRDFLESEDDQTLINPTLEEIEVLKSIRFASNFNPPKKFYIEALKHYRQQS